MSTNTFTQPWDVIYENEIESWEVEGWSDFASEHDHDTYYALGDLGGLTEKGVQCLNTNGITTTAHLLAHGLIHSDDIQAWLVSIGFIESEDGFPEFVSGLYQRLARAELVAYDTEEEEEENTHESSSEKGWCTIS
mgnify:CR=1 FL=1